MENTTTQGTHWRVPSDRNDNLRRIIVGIEKTFEVTREFNEETGGGMLDGDEESESIWGLALIAMQNCINMTCIILQKNYLHGHARSNGTRMRVRIEPVRTKRQ